MSEEKDPYKIIRLDRGNIGDLDRLYQKVYGKSRPPGYFARKYDTAYTGTEWLGFIAYCLEVPVAYYGVVPCFIECGKERILAAQSADTMTDPAYRFRGMFVNLSKMTFDLCRKAGIRLLFGFPNQNSLHGAVNKLGWLMTETMDGFTIPVKTFPLAGMATRFPLLGSLYRRYRSRVTRKKSPLEGISNSVLANGYAAVLRNPAYFEHKKYSDTFVLEYAGARAWISARGTLLIGDMEGVTENNFITVMDNLKRLARRLGIRSIQFHGSPGTKLHELFSGTYKARPSYPSLFQDFGSPILPEKVKFTLADLDIF